MNAETHVFSTEVEEEISDRLDNFGPPNEMNDFQTLTRSEVVKEIMQDSDDEEHALFGFAKQELRQFGIDVGVYREITKEEMNNMQVMRSSGKRCQKYDFKQDGKFYLFDSWSKLNAKEGERAVA